MPNTTVTITYANGATREFIASDELEKSINEGEMFSVTTMHSDISIDEEMSVSKMYVGNPIAAMGHMMMMKRNAEQLLESTKRHKEKKQMKIVIEILTTCIVFLSDEINSHQSGMTPVNDNWCKGCNPDNCSGCNKETSDAVPIDDGTGEREPCPVINNYCDHYIFQHDRNGEVAIEHCKHPDNSSDTEGNCKITLCPFCKTEDDHCEHGKKLNDYCQPCGRVNGGS